MPAYLAPLGYIVIKFIALPSSTFITEGFIIPAVVPDLITTPTSGPFY